MMVFVLVCLSAVIITHSFVVTQAFIGKLGQEVSVGAGNPPLADSIEF